jgi:hypothetical protein
MENLTGTIVGWGDASDAHDKGPNHLNFALNLRVISNRECGRLYPQVSDRPFHDRQLCIDTQSGPALCDVIIIYPTLSAKFDIR